MLTQSVIIVKRLPKSGPGSSRSAGIIIGPSGTARSCASPDLRAEHPPGFTDHTNRSKRHAVPSDPPKSRLGRLLSRHEIVRSRNASCPRPPAGLHQSGISPLPPDGVAPMHAMRLTLLVFALAVTG